MRELSIATRKTNPIHNDVPEKTTFLLLDQPSEEANTTGTLISKIEEVAINAKTANWKAIVMLIILQAINRTIPFDPSISQKIVINSIMKGFDHEPIDPIELITTLFRHGVGEKFLFTLQTDMLDHRSIIDSHLVCFYR